MCPRTNPASAHRHHLSFCTPKLLVPSATQIFRSCTLVNARRKSIKTMTDCDLQPVMVSVQASADADNLLTLQTSTALYRVESIGTGSKGVLTFQLLMPQDAQVQLAWVPHASGTSASSRNNALCKFQVNNQDVRNQLQVSTIPGTATGDGGDGSSPATSSTNNILAPFADIPTGTVLTWFGVGVN